MCLNLHDHSRTRWDQMILWTFCINLGWPGYCEWQGVNSSGCYPGSLWAFSVLIVKNERGAVIDDQTALTFFTHWVSASPFINVVGNVSQIPDCLTSLLHWLLTWRRSDVATVPLQQSQRYVWMWSRRKQVASYFCTMVLKVEAYTDHLARS